MTDVTVKSGTVPDLTRDPLKRRLVRLVFELVIKRHRLAKNGIFCCCRNGIACPHRANVVVNLAFEKPVFVNHKGYTQCRIITLQCFVQSQHHCHFDVRKVTVHPIAFHRQPLVARLYQKQRSLSNVRKQRIKAPVFLQMPFSGGDEGDRLAPRTARLGRSRSRQSTGLSLCTAPSSIPLVPFCKKQTKKRSTCFSASTSLWWR